MFANFNLHLQVINDAYMTILVYHRLAKVLTCNVSELLKHQNPGGSPCIEGTRFFNW
jgi:hypothetical protein